MTFDVKKIGMRYFRHLQFSNPAYLGINLLILFTWQQIVKELINQPAIHKKKDDRS
jgi:hypothetical protein